jgi:hypothetical protein
MEKQLSLVLPAEVAQIAENVSVEKRNEVQSVLNHVFNGVSKMREQLDGVIVTDANDKVNMKLANTIRLGVRQVRLEAEKTFDAKRTEVQQQMLNYKTEDQLWLKAKQTMQILTKEIEENARWKEETKERFEDEQKELKTQQRMLKVAKVSPEIARSEFENMSDDTFEIFFAGVEKAYNDKIEAEAKAEAERIAKAKAEAEERERIRKENEALKKQAEERERLATIERKKQAEILAEQKRKSEIEKAKLEEKARKEREERERLEKQIKAKKEAEDLAQKQAQEKAIKEEKERAEALKKALKAPDKEKLNKWIDDIFIGFTPSVGGDAHKVACQIQDKFSGFKRWAKEQIENL